MNAEVFIRSMVARALMSRTRRRLLHGRARLRRRLAGGGPLVYYFHQVDDPYSHLAVQAIARLRERYSVQFVPYLVPDQGGIYAGDAQRYPHWTLADAMDVAPFYGLSFPAGATLPEAAAVMLANRRLVGKLGSEGFADAAIEAGETLWGGIGGEAPPNSEQAAEESLREGERLRYQLGHYRGGMFHFEGEWYWGVDRLHRLESRLVAEGFSRSPDAPICVPRPRVQDAATHSAESLALEFFPSLRSPYTAISFRRTLKLAARWGLRLELKPVMPMMMRGVPAPRTKGIFILNDARQEAEAAGERFGRMVDPFGEPVKMAFSLYPWALECGRAAEYLQSYLDAAFADGIDISSRRGLRQVVERAGLDWGEASTHLGRDGWQPMLERNLADMHEAGLWGVPSYRLSGGAKPGRFSCWGQDRLWRLEEEIAQRVQPS